MKKFYVQTFGCQMNVADSDFMAAHLVQRGMARATDLADADTVILNTCSVRQHAEHRALSFIGRLEPFKKKNPALQVIVAGCTAEKEKETLQQRFPIIDLVVGAKDIDHFPEIFDQAFASGRGAVSSSGTPVKTGRITSFVTIMRGCENFCSYCIVPYVRGKEKSRPADEITADIQNLAKQGSKEVLLLGQNVNSYRSDGVDFPGLLSLINDIPDIERIRFMTSHPKDLSDRLIDAMAGLPKVCEHLHLPLQSGSDRILAAMNRRYNAAGYRAIIDKLRKAIPGASVTTDILVGYPGETDEDFNATMALINAIDFDFLFAFKYSARPGTAAAGLPDSVPETVKEERHAQVLDAINGIAARKNATLLGTVVEVLVENCRDGQCDGRTRTNKKVFFPSDGTDLSGRLLRIVVTSSRLNSLSGIIEKNGIAHHA